MTDWETRSLQYVVNAIESAEKRQLKLWKQIIATRRKDGLITIDWPTVTEFVEACRRLNSMMIDLEMVGREFEAKKKTKKKAGRSRPAARAKRK